MVALRKTETPMLVTTYLEMTSRSGFRPAYISGTHFTIEQMQTLDVNFYRFLYNAVGEQWCWRERNLLSDAELTAILAQSKVYVLYCDGVPAGYVELAPHGSEMEIAYFGIRPAYFGRGFGKHLLSYGIAQAWASGASRVWLHTCNLDSPQALDNYLKRGFKVYDVQRERMPELFL
ncbi:MAG: GNAT family N-acetyltransferase [Anaerolineae bacterium]|jgi:ribosomal protein S18 acetylase RimI-like enzyme|nr:GNAT family N-acetyltransferase [Anaerolineae bacterium]